MVENEDEKAWAVLGGLGGFRVGDEVWFHNAVTLQRPYRVIITSVNPSPHWPYMVRPANNELISPFGARHDELRATAKIDRPQDER